VRKEASVAKKALVVGISDYRELGISLPGADTDRAEWRQLLQEVHHFQTTNLTNPTKAELVKALETLMKGSNDNNVFACACHGTTIKTSNKVSQGVVAFKPNGVSAAKVEDYVLLDEELLTIIRGLDTGATLTVLLDCCYAAGNISPFALMAERVQRRGSSIRFLSLEKVASVATLQAESPATVLATLARGQQVEPAMAAASTIDGPAFEDDELEGAPNGTPHGVFSYFATRALTSNPKLSVIDLVKAIGPDVTSVNATQTANVPSNSAHDSMPFLP
jgi:hypothetical protein